MIVYLDRQKIENNILNFFFIGDKYKLKQYQHCGVKAMNYRVSSLLLAGLSSILGVSIVGAADAQEQNSKVSIGYTFATVDDADLGLITARYNYSFTDYFAVEGDIGFGVSDGELDIGDELDGAFVPVASEASADFAGGLFAVGQYPFDVKGSNVFLRIGYQFSSIDSEADDFDVNVDVDADGFAAGLGLNYFFTDRHGVRFDYTYYNAEVDFEDFDVSGSDAMPMIIMGGEEEADVDQFTVAYVFQF